VTALTYRPSRTQAGLLLLAGAVLLALAVAVPPLGRVLLVPAAVAVAAVGLRDLLLVPTLEADAEGLTVALTASKQAYAWSNVTRVRVITDRRTPLLELDLDHTVVVLSRRRLGTAPYLVLEELDTVRMR
jgi:membrane protein implicated in regulation of membrane protease activity